MAEEPQNKRTITEIIKQPQFPAYIILIILGLYLQIQFLILNGNALFGTLLLFLSLGSVVTTFLFWRKYIPKTAPKVIVFSVSNFVGQKLISGGSDIYREDNVVHSAIGRFTPLGRVFNILIAFLGIATALLKTLNVILPDLTPTNPTDGVLSFFGWMVLMFLIPLILTVITPVIWVMEDLGLKVWNSKKIITWRISDKYRMKFNGFISIGALISIFTIGQNTSVSFFDNIILFGLLLLNGTSLLLLPMIILTIIYFEKFRSEITAEVLQSIDLPVAKTERIYTYKPDSETSEDALESLGDTVDDQDAVVEDSVVEKAPATNETAAESDNSFDEEVAEVSSEISSSTTSVVSSTDSNSEEN